MKTLRTSLFLLLILSVLAWSSCSEDDDLVVDALRYHTGFQTVPAVDANMYAAFFPTDEVNPYLGQKLERVVFYLETLPPEVEVIIFDAGNGINPDNSNIIYRSGSLRQRINALGEFITHRLQTPIELSDHPEGLWIAIRTDVPRSDLVASIACDNGSRYNPNGDYIRIGDEWLHFASLEGVTINWVIEGLLSEAE